MDVAQKRQWLYAGLAVLMCLGGVEVALRLVLREVARVTMPEDKLDSHLKGGMVYDPYLGWKWPPGRDNVGHNEQSFRYPEDIETAKPAGVWRGFTLGDSQTFGAGVEPHESYTAFAERALRAQVPGRTIQLINTGTSGYTSLQALRLISRTLLDYEPDLLVVDCHFRDSPRDDFVPSPSPAVAWLQERLFHLRIYYVLRVAVDRLNPNAPARMKVDTSPHSPGGDHGNHDLIAELARERGIGVLFVDYPFWDHGSNTIVSLMPPKELPSGARAAEVTPALLSSGRPASELFLDNNHPTVLGNQIIGEALARVILTSPWSPGP